MTREKAQRIVLLMLSVSLLIISVKGLLTLLFPSQYKTSEKDTKRTDVTTDQIGASGQKIAELPVKDQLAADTTINEDGVHAWPDESTVPVYHSPNLEIFKSRHRDERPLEGVQLALFLPAEQAKETKQTEETDGGAPSPDEESAGQVPGAEEFDLDSNSVRRDIVDALTASLEKMGAEVYVLSNSTEKMTAKNMAASLGQVFINRFTEELRDQDFQSQRINELKPILAAWTAKQEPDQYQSFFSDLGVSRNMRLLLDIERQYTDCLGLVLSFADKNSETQGVKLTWYGDDAKRNGVKGQVTEEGNQQPAYFNYDVEGRARLARLIKRNIVGLQPELINGQAMSTNDSDLGRFSNIVMVEMELGRLSNPIDSQIYKSAENRRVIAEALANAVYEFYCTDIDG